MKISNVLKVLSLAVFIMIGAPLFGSVIAEGLNLDLQTTINATAVVLFIGACIPRPDSLALFADAPDISAMATTFVKFGGNVLRKAVNTLSIKNNKEFYRFYPNMTQPLVLPKLSAAGNPRPYRSNDDSAGNDIDITDRILTAHQSKWDFSFDYEKFHNTYMASLDERPYEQAMMETMAEDYWAQINDGVIYSGILDAAGSDAADITNGWGTHIAVDIAGAAAISVTATGAVTNANSVAKVESMLSGLPAWAREQGKVEVIMSYGQFDNYKTNYRATYTYQFNPRQDGFYYLDGTNIKIRPESFMASSNRIIFSEKGNLAWGLKGDSIKMYATANRNIIELRPMITIGTQIADLKRIWVNDQA